MMKFHYREALTPVMVKLSQSISVHDMIQKIESHPQREAIQNDLQQHRAFNPFSEKSKDAIMAAGNTELCEIINVEAKLQCKACLNALERRNCLPYMWTPYER